jgi:tripartite-type tricarboxylate transporter receptor subunit TctC
MTRFALSAFVFIFCVANVFAQAPQSPWPTKPVRLVVGFPPGSSPDAVARVLSESLAQVLGQPVIVENKPGASGNIAASQVAHAVDDHTLGIVINGNLTSSKMLFSKLPFDPERDFTFITLVGTAPLVLVAQAGAESGVAFFESARQLGDKLNYGSVGTGSVAHLGMELLKSRYPGFVPHHVPFSGNPQVVTALIGKQIEMALVAPGVALPQVKAGRVKAIGVTSGRSTLAPEVPSLADAGIKDFELEVWTALIGPANLSAAAKQRLRLVLPAILQNEQTRQRLFNHGWLAQRTASASVLQERIKVETKAMQKIIASQHIKIE